MRLVTPNADRCWNPARLILLLSMAVLAASSSCSDRAARTERSSIEPAIPAQAGLAAPSSAQLTGFELVQPSKGVHERPTARTVNRTHGLALDLDDTGRVRLTGRAAANGAWAANIELVSIRRGDSRLAAPAVTAGPELASGRASYVRADVLREWYESGPNGVEQGFDIGAPMLSGSEPQGAPLVLEVAVRDDLHPEPSARPGEIVLRTSAGALAAHYSGLTVRDARGTLVPSWMSVESSSILLAVRDQDAAYPISIDPVVWVQQQKLEQDGVGTLADQLGSSVAISGDTAVVGAPGSDEGGVDAGAAYVFVRSGTAWIQQQKLVASASSAGDHFGYAVAVDGDVALIGAHGDDDVGTDTGAVYVFVRSAGVWTQQKKVVPTGAHANASFGNAVALDGATALVGAYGEDTHGTMAGAAFVLGKDQGGTNGWGQVAKLDASDGAAQDNFGIAVALSGGTALIGARGDDDHGSMSGSAYVFVQSGATWSQQAKLSASDGAPIDYFGDAVAVDGDTAVIGAHLANTALADAGSVADSGSAYVFVRSGTTWTEQKKLESPDGGIQDSFGSAVAVAGDFVLVGASGDDEKATGAGATYVFVRAGTDWSFHKKIMASDGGGADGFGSHVALDGTTAIVASPADDDSGANAGAAYLFDRDEGGLEAWGETAKVKAADALALEYFGYAIALSGDTLLAGTYGADDAGKETGAAYVLVRSGATWAEQARLVASDATSGDRFGFAVSLSGDTALMGAYLRDGVDVDTGAAYVFTRTGGVWTQEAELVAPDAAASDDFGVSVAVDGDTALIGAHLDDDAGNNCGAAYVFVRSAGVWVMQKKLVAADAAAGDAFGRSVALRGDVALVGAQNDDDTATNSGSVYVFVRTGTTWTQEAKLHASDPNASAAFGVSLALDTDEAIVGAYLSDATDTDTGAAYVFTRDGTTWTQQARLLAADAEQTDRFGIGVALQGGTALVGAQYEDDKGSNAGAAYVFARSGSTWSQQAKLLAFDGAANDYLGTTVALDGETAFAGAYGDDDKGSASGAIYTFALKRTDGTDCGADDECESGYCTDGVCCNVGACPDCQSCAMAGSLGQCSANAAAMGEPCGDQSATDCSFADSCDGAGVCQPHHRTEGTPCGDITDSTCSAPDSCDGMGTCLANDAPAGTACGDASATECTAADTCSGSGTCLSNDEQDGTTCAGGECQAGACVAEADSGTGGAGGSAGAGGSGAAAGSGGAGGQAQDGGTGGGAPGAASEGESDGGCGCRAAGRAPAGGSFATLVGMLAGALLWRGRRRRRAARLSASVMAASALLAGCGSQTEVTTPPSGGGGTAGEGDAEAGADVVADTSADRSDACPAAQQCGLGCCPAGYDCVQSTCLPACPSPGERCGAALDVCCGEDQDCVEGECVAACPGSGIRCGPSNECCDTGQVCVFATCATPGAQCADYADCAEDEYCEPTLKVCLPTALLPECEYHPPVGDFAPYKEWTYGPTTAPYAREPGSLAVTDVCHGDGIPLAFPDADESLVAVNLGAVSIPFFDQARSTMVVSTNGWLSLRPSAALGPEPNNTSFPHGSEPDAIVAPYWDDLRNVTACALVDTSSQRVVVQWHGEVAGTGEWVTFQASMNASGNAEPGVVEFAYLQLGATQDGDGATVGIAEPSTYRSVLHGFNQNGSVSTSRKLRFRWVALHNRFDALTPPAVFDLDGDGRPEVIFPPYDDDPVAYSTMPNDPIHGLHSGVLTILNGEDGTIQARPEETVGYDGYLGGGVALSVGDLDLDGKVEIVGLGRLDPMVDAKPYVKAFSADGTLLWVSDQPVNINHNGWAGSVNLADLDADGHPEIYFGLNVYSSQGILQWAQPTEYGSTLTTAADLDGDGKLEVVSDHSAWHHDGTNLWTRSDLTAYHFPAVADFNQDGHPEVALVSDGSVIILHGDDGETFWGPVSLQTNGGGPLNIGDFDGDGLPEIGTAGEGLYAVVDLQCTGDPLPAGCDREGIRWGAATKDISSNVTGSSLFDFEGDGKAEVIYSDECFTRVYSGSDGMVLFETPVNTRTATEYPLVADVDGDNNAEIIVVANESVTSCQLAPWNVGVLGTPWKQADYPPPFCGKGTCGYRGLSVYGDALDNWVRTRPVWSGHTYHITNVLADGRIPSPEEENWLHLGYNNFRMNAQGEAAFSAPNLQVSLEAGTQLCPARIRLAATVSNVGALGVSPGVNVAFFLTGSGSPVCLGTAATVVDLLPGASTVVTLDYVLEQADIGKQLGFRARVDSDCAGGGLHNECENGGEDDNEAEATGECQVQGPK